MKKVNSVDEFVRVGIKIYFICWANATQSPNPRENDP